MRMCIAYRYNIPNLYSMDVACTLSMQLKVMRTPVWNWIMEQLDNTEGIIPKYTGPK